MKSSRFFSVDDTLESKKEKLKNHMDGLKSMSVREFTFYKKWKEVQDYKDKLDTALDVKSKIWRPEDIEDKERTVEELENLNPKIKLVETEREEEIWLMLRVFSHSMSFDQSPGRFLKFLVYTEVDSDNSFIDFDKEKRYLGAVSLSSDAISLGVRDEYIGWDREDREDDGMLAHTTIASCIMSTQPFGYNFIGGKLIGSLVCSPTVQKAWKEQYGNRLVGITTTSLYGSYSMYNGIKYFKKLGKSKGQIFLKPDDDVYDEWHQWLKKNKPERHEEITDPGDSAGPATGVKQAIVTEIFREAGLSPSNYKHGFKRGVYFAMLYKNGKEFLRGEISENQLEKKEKIKKGRQGIIDWWLPKSIRRYKKLYDRGDLKPEVLYYTDIMGSSWEEAKEKYISEVGR